MNNILGIKKRKKMETMLRTIRIIDDNSMVSRSFNMQEYYHPPLAFANKEFDIPESLVNGVQKLREYWNVPLKITSVFRPNDTYGYHKQGHAVDLNAVTDPLKYIDIFIKECNNHKKSELVRLLRKEGVKGFGLESGNCLHIDYRPDSNCSSKDEFGMYCVFTWDSKNGSKVIY